MAKNNSHYETVKYLRGRTFKVLLFLEKFDLTKNKQAKKLNKVHI